MRWQAGEDRLWETGRGVPRPAGAAAIIASQSASVDAIGFSMSTCTPARAAAIVGAAWAGWGVQMMSACTPARLIISSTSAKASTRYFSENAVNRAVGLPHTATNSDSGSALSAAAWRWDTLPVPNSAVLSLFMGFRA